VQPVVARRGRRRVDARPQQHHAISDDRRSEHIRHRRPGHALDASPDIHLCCANDGAMVTAA